jgi:hypothetical protein
MQEQTQPIGYLFDSISYYGEKDVEKFIDSMLPEQAFYAITQALNFAHSKNVFSLMESEVVSKSLRVLSTPKEVKETPTEK